MNKESGIYLILNTVNNKKYVGSSIRISKRFKEHKQSLKKGIHVNSYLQHSYKKYGAESFKYSILEHCDDHELLARESKWCSDLNTHNSNFGYNLATILRGGPISEELRQQQINDAIGSKRVFIFNSKGNIVNTFKSKREAARILCVTDNYVYRLITEKIIYKNLYLLTDNQYISKEDIYSSIYPNNLYQFTKEGIFIKRHNTVSEAISITGVTSIYEAFKVRTNNPLQGGFLWSKTDNCPVSVQNENKKIYCYSKEGEFITEFNSRKEACEYVDGKIKGLEKSLYSDTRTYKGLNFTKIKL